MKVVAVSARAALCHVLEGRMDEARAAEIMKAALELDTALGELDRAISRIPDEAERREYARKLADIMGGVNDAIIRPLARRFPKLDPT
jgi:hypothetical protein